MFEGVGNMFSFFKKAINEKTENDIIETTITEIITQNDILNKLGYKFHLHPKNLIRAHHDDDLDLDIQFNNNKVAIANIIKDTKYVNNQYIHKNTILKFKLETDNYLFALLNIIQKEIDFKLTLKLSMMIDREKLEKNYAIVEKYEPLLEKIDLNEKISKIDIENCIYKIVRCNNKLVSNGYIMKYHPDDVISNTNEHRINFHLSNINSSKSLYHELINEDIKIKVDITRTIFRDNIPYTCNEKDRYYIIPYKCINGGYTEKEYTDKLLISIDKMIKDNDRQNQILINEIDGLRENKKIVESICNTHYKSKTIKYDSSIWEREEQ